MPPTSARSARKRRRRPSLLDGLDVHAPKEAPARPIGGVARLSIRRLQRTLGNAALGRILSNSRNGHALDGDSPLETQGILRAIAVREKLPGLKDALPKLPLPKEKLPRGLPSAKPASGKAPPKTPEAKRKPGPRTPSPATGAETFPDVAAALAVAGKAAALAAGAIPGAKPAPGTPAPKPTEAKAKPAGAKPGASPATGAEMFPDVAAALAVAGKAAALAAGAAAPAAAGAPKEAVGEAAAEGKAPAEIAPEEKPAAGEAPSGAKAAPGAKEVAPKEKEAKPPEGTKAVEKGAELPKDPKTAPGPEEKVPSAPPEANPRVKAALGRLEQAAKKEKAHAPARQKVGQARAAARPPENEGLSRGQAAQVDVMAQQQPTKPPKNDFLSMLRAALAAIAPSNMEEMTEFKKEGKAAQMKEALTGGVKQKTEQAQAGIKGATEAEPRPAPTADPQPLPEEPAPGAVPRIGAEEAVPPPRAEEEVSARADVDEANREMAEAGVDEEQLRTGNEPVFDEALKAKGELEVHAQEMPKQYREAERAQIAETAAAMGADEVTAMQQMRGQRQSARGAVAQRQQEAMTKEEAARKQVADKIDQMFAATKAKVEERLAGLEAKAMAIFDEGEKSARENFETFVDQKMTAYKEERYSGVLGKGRWLKDKFLGLPSGVNKFYTEGKERYLKEMDGVLVRLADGVEAELKAAKDEITKGRAEIKNYVAGLPKELQAAGKEAERGVSERFKELESSVDDAKQQLAQKMAQRYQEATKKLDERIEELKAKNKGLLGAFIDKLKAIIEIIRNFKERFLSILGKAGDLIMAIIKDPIGFLGKLLDALKMGFTNFTTNILQHLKAGLMGWLFGTLGEAGIKVPSSFDLKSIFAMVLQVLGITAQRIRSKIAKIVGERAVRTVEKVWEFVSALISGGLEGLWDYIKDFIGNLKDMILEAVQGFIITKIVKAAITRLIALFNPVGAFIAALQAIYNTVMFFIERANQIMELVNAVVQSVSKIVRGALGEAAQWIENAMGRAVPVIISFLARLLGLGGISDKIREVVGKLRSKVDKALDKAIAKIVTIVKPLLAKAKAFAGRVRERVTTGVRAVRERVTAGARAVRERLRGRRERAPGEGAEAARPEKLSHEERWRRGAAGVRAELASLPEEALGAQAIRTRFPRWQRQFGFTELAVEPEGDKLVIKGQMSATQEIAEVEPEERAGFSPEQIAAFRRLLGKPLTHGDVSILGEIWRAAANPGEEERLTRENSRQLFDNHRNRFWRAVRGSSEAVALFETAGCVFTGAASSAPTFTLPSSGSLPAGAKPPSSGQIRLTVDHIEERQSRPERALDPSNLRIVSSRENTVVLRLIHQLDPFQRHG